ncbi:MAG: hypothetical protein ACRD0K_29110, partial [Egibacteraceae bacterium]
MGREDGTFINSERRVGPIKRVARAPGVALADFAIFKLIAQAWGCAKLFGERPSPEAAFAIPQRLSGDGRFFHPGRRARVDAGPRVRHRHHPTRQVFIPMHCPDTNRLTDAVFDPYSRQPSYKHAPSNSAAWSTTNAPPCPPLSPHHPTPDHAERRHSVSVKGPVSSVRGVARDTTLGVLCSFCRSPILPYLALIPQNTKSAKNEIVASGDVSAQPSHA